MAATDSQANTAQNALNTYNSQNALPGQASYNPTLLDPSGLGQVQASTYGGAQVGQAQQLDPNQIAQITQGNSPDLSAQAQIQQILAGFAPQAQQQQANLQDQLAAGGLSGGPAIAAQNNLSRQQTGALAPTLASAIQNSQSNQLNQGQFNSSQLISALSGNQSANNANQTLQAQLNQQAGLSNQDAYNTANTANTGAYNSTLASNTAAQNAAQNAYLQQLQSQYLDQFSAFNSINDAALGAQNNISVQGAQNFGVPTGASDAYSGLGTSFGSLFAPTAKTAAATPAAT